MNRYLGIEEALPRLMNEFDWYDSFIREVYVVSEIYREEVRDPDGTASICEGRHRKNLRLLVAAAGNESIFGLEFLCVGVEVFSLRTLYELSFSCQIERRAVYLRFTDDDENWVVAETVKVAFLGRECLGPLLRLGYEAPAEDAIVATDLGDSWRQCADCSNAWQEKPEVEYSRCPECGELTVLHRNE